MATNNTESTAISMAGLGEKLKEAREKKGLTIEETQKHTHIHSSVIRALEEGRCDEMLTPTYVKSFLKKYSQYLGLDQKETQKAYAAVHPELQNQVINMPSPLEDRSFSIGGLMRFARSVIIFIVVVFIFAFVWNKAVHFLKEVRLSHASRPVKAAKTVPRQTAARKSNVAPARTSSRKEAPKEEVNRSDSPRITVSKNTPLKLSLTVKQAVLIGLKADDRLIFKRVMPKGSVETFTAKNSFNIYVAKAESIELSLNGQSFSPGKGVVENIEITRKGIRVK
ncbi:MAG: helix-turn-helix transcriptional regulator [Candidatus Omnitrophota bacterium]